MREFSIDHGSSLDCQESLYACYRETRIIVKTGADSANKTLLILLQYAVGDTHANL